MQATPIVSPGLRCASKAGALEPAAATPALAARPFKKGSSSQGVIVVHKFSSEDGKVLRYPEIQSAPHEPASNTNALS